MGRRQEWRVVLESEVQRWSELDFESLVEAVGDVESYTVERGAKVYQVEVQMLRKTDSEAHVFISVDDGSLPESLAPASATFVVRRVSKTSTYGPV